MALIRTRRNALVTATFLSLILFILYHWEPLIPHPLALFEIDSELPWDIQSPRLSRVPKNQSVQIERREAVKAEFLHAWNGYKTHAWMKDEIWPVSGGGLNKFCGWAATLIDSLDTLWIMGLHDEFDIAVQAVNNVSFVEGKTCVVNLFETTIRHLGGLLGAYDISGGNNEILLKKIHEVGEMLYAAFQTPNGMPDPFFDWPSSENKGMKASSEVVLAILGSLDLEFTRLSQVTRDIKYFLATEKITDEFLAWQDSTTLPGMWPSMVDSTGGGFSAFDHFPNNIYTLGALSDSAYEYLPKEYLMLGAQSGKYKSLWLNAVEAIKENLLFKPMTKDQRDILFTATVDMTFSGHPLKKSDVEHLACFEGGMFALSSRLFNRSEDLIIAEKLTNGCVWAYESTPSGIMPEQFRVIPCEDINSPCEWDEERWQNLPAVKEQHLPPGFVDVIDRKYILRPEAIESIFIMYRITGDSSWRDKGWKMFEAIRNNTRSGLAHSSIDNVMKSKPALTNEMESFWLAETLKYFYLLFSEPNLVSLDEYVLSTEAHPLRISKNPLNFK